MALEQRRAAGGAGFPATRRSLVAAVCGEDAAARRRAWEGLAASYWQPVYVYLRRHWGAAAAEAEDLTQEFFAQALGGGAIERFDPQRARFRTYLRVCVDGFVLNRRKAAARLKRGGGIRSFGGAGTAGSTGGDVGADEVAGAAPDPEELFHREWVRGLFAAAVADLRRQCEGLGLGAQLAIFQRYDLAAVDDPQSGNAGGGGSAVSATAGGRPSYAELAAELGIPVTQVTNHLAAARRRFRRLVIARLRRMTASEAELRAEARSLFGVELAAAIRAGER